MAEEQTRSSPRTRCSLTAEIRFNGGRTTFAAVVRNISLSGALLESPDADATPEAFDLVVSMPDGSRATHHARQVWRHSGAMGVAFVAPARMAVRLAG